MPPSQFNQSTRPLSLSQLEPSSPDSSYEHKLVANKQPIAIKHARRQELLRHTANQDFGERRACESWGIAALAVRDCEGDGGTNTSLTFVSIKATAASSALQQKAQLLTLQQIFCILTVHVHICPQGPRWVELPVNYRSNQLMLSGWDTSFDALPPPPGSPANHGPETLARSPASGNKRSIIYISVLSVEDDGNNRLSCYSEAASAAVLMGWK